MIEKSIKIEFTWLSDLIDGKKMFTYLTDKTYGYALCQGVAAVLIGFIPLILTMFEGRGFVVMLVVAYLASFPLGRNLFRWLNELKPDPKLNAKLYEPDVTERLQFTEISEITGKPKPRKPPKRVATP
jgi:hypothetical protein